VNSNSLDITDQAKRSWNSISPTRKAKDILNNPEHLQDLSGMDELCVLVSDGPDEIQDLVDDIETIFD
jgi:hypothetical protein